MSNSSTLLYAKGLSEKLYYILAARKDILWYWNYTRKYLQIKNHIDNLIEKYEAKTITIIEFSNKLKYFDSLFIQIQLREHQAQFKNIRYDKHLAEEG